ncbi:MAG TPA: efflux RND transporter periplasmic adaptor subunit [Gemmataceae bacterium]|nr:efflux RND transporter periplasmic adaptor subunit [Gemmataceae bacterium]
MKAYWLIGILVLVASFIAVPLVLKESASVAAKGKKDADDDLPPNMVVCWGNFDGEKGVAALDPNQFGNVTEVAAENAHVKKGTVLLQVADPVAKLKVQAAQQQLAEAKKLPDKYKFELEQQNAAIEAVKIERKSRLKSLETNSSKTLYNEAEALYAEKLKVEEAKKKLIQLQDASLKIAQADTQLKEAEEFLKLFQVVAPDDGTVLRVNIRKGEAFTSSAMRHAIEFLPDAPVIVKAEVLQEWGSYIRLGQDVVIEDDTYKGPKWTGKVQTISKWYAPTRSPSIEPFRMNDVRTLECLITNIEPEKGNTTQPRIGQRVRAKIKIDAPK